MNIISKILAGPLCCLALATLPTLPIIAAPRDNVIKVGALFSVTGPAAFLGAPEAKTAQMVADKINAAGGVDGRKIQLIIKDTAGSPEKTVSFARQLIEEERVLAIIGPSTSGETMQIKNLCEENQTLLISCAAAEVIVKPVAKYVFKTAQNDSAAIAWIYRHMKDKNITRIAILTGNDGFGVAGKKQLEDAAKAAGLEIAANEVYDKQATDLTDILTKVKSAAGVQAVVNWSIVPAQSIVAKNMRQLGMTIPLYQSHGFGNRKYVEQAGVAAEGILFPASRLLVAHELPDNHPQKAVLTAYLKDYETQFKEEASAFGGYAHDALMLVVEGVRRAQSTDPAKVRDTLEKLKNFVGVTGTFSFSPMDHGGLGLDAFEMLTVRDGKFTIYKP